MAQRNYKREYELFQSSDIQKKRRAKRNLLRNIFKRKGKVRKGDNNDVHHNRSGARVLHRSVNRGMNSSNRGATQGDINARG